MRVLAPQQVRPFHEPVVVVGHARDVHEPVHVVLDEFHEQAERRHARDVAIELVADLVRHEPHLLPGEQFVLGLVGPALHLGRVARQVGKFLDAVLQLLLVQRPEAVLAQCAMHDQVRIAADG